MRDFVVEYLGNENAVPVVDETGDLKKGTASVGVQRQCTGTAGRIENAQVAVCLAYSSPAGHAAIDRRLYVPRSWAQDLDRCRAAGITGDEVYGGDPHLSAELKRRQVGYVLAVSCKRPIPTRAGVFVAGVPARCLPKKAWQRLSAGDGAKGRHYDDWAQVEINDPKQGAGNRSLSVRRNRRTGELAFHRCHSAAPVPLTTLVRVAGRGWTVEETFQPAKGLAGLDEHQVRRWTSWHRWTTLAILAHAFLVVTAASRKPPAHSSTSTRQKSLVRASTVGATRPTRCKVAAMAGTDPQARAERRSAGELESEVLAALWATDRPLTPAEIQAEIDGPLAYNTVHTILKRLYDKGLVLRDADGRRGAYRPAKNAAELTAEAMREALDRGPDPIAALQQFVTGLRPEEERALRDLLAGGAG